MISRPSFGELAVFVDPENDIPRLAKDLTGFSVMTQPDQARGDLISIF